MSDERVERRLAAILAADVAGYSRLMGANEEGTLAQLKSVRKALVEPTIAAHRGRLVKTTGDGMLVEFASAVDAVRNAVEIQRSMAEQNTAVPQDQRIEFRMGIHVGDIIFDDNDIFGDGVNIAARLEGIAEPGGVCMSDDAYRQVRGKVEIACDDMGQQSLKNIAEPMRAWRVRLTGQAPSAVNSGLAMSQPQVLLPRQAVRLPAVPNMSAIRTSTLPTEWEDIITALSLKALFIIACFRFHIQGRAVDVKQIGRGFKGYVLKAAFASGSRVRTGQLVDTAAWSILGRSV